MKNLPLLLSIVLASSISFSQQTHKSIHPVGIPSTRDYGIHQQQSEEYSKYNFTSEKDWDNLRITENAPSARGPSLKENFTVNVFPNPSPDGKFTVYGLKSTVELSIYNVLGEKLFSKTVNNKQETSSKKTKGAKGFHAGLYVGSYHANKYTSKLYDGWGYDENGKRNDFEKSFMKRRINYDFGGGNGQPDQVALALGVNPGEWSFDKTDMPQKMKYKSTFIFGVQMNYGFTKKDALVVNVSAAKINLTGNFTIVVTNPLIGPQQPGYKDIKTFSITGGEQRLLFQMGYRRILGDNEILNFFVEAGPSFNFTKYFRNQIAINNLPIDLAFYYTQPYYPTYRANYLRGTGLGAFASFGLNLTANPKWTLQFLYNPSFEKINIGEEPKLTLQNSFGLRAFYNL